MKITDYFGSNNTSHKLIVAIVVMILCLVLSTAGATEAQIANTGGKSETKIPVSTKEKEQKMLCEKVSMLIKNKTIEKYALDSVIVPDMPKTDSILNIDIDGDDISDKIIRSCGTGECGLDIALSSGGNIEFGTSPFFLIRIGGKIYALVAQEQEYSQPGSKPVFSLYLITIKGVQEVCNTYEGR